MRRFKILYNTILNRLSLRKMNVKISFLALFDDKCSFEDNIHVDRFSILHLCNIGKYTYITTNCEISNCKIGRFCSIAGGVKIGLGKHPLDYISTSPIFYSFKNKFGIKWNENDSVIEGEHTIIGNDVWIGTNAIIPGGINVGDGGVIAAGAVVTKDVPPYAVVAGVPAKIIKYRFDDEKIKSLLDIKWWNLAEEKLINNAKYFNDIDEFIKNIKKVSEYENSTY